MKRPIIGIIPLYDENKESLWMLPGYVDVVEQCGGLAIVLPLTDNYEILSQAYGICDGILMTGGHDVSPELYGEKRSPKCGNTCQLRDSMEKYILECCIRDDKPILGICRGIQFMNAYLGGTLFQDLPTEHPSRVEHCMKPPYDRAVHDVTVLEGTQLARIIGQGLHRVNSYHHQAIKVLSSKVDKMAISEDGLIEAIAVKNHRFAIGVQWHPEFSYKTSEESIKLVKAFVNECIK